MATPAESHPATAELNIKDVDRQLESFQQIDSTRQQLFKRLVQRLTELDSALQIARSDLEDQTSIRRQWKKRAEVAEFSLARNQFALVLIDGDRYTFTDMYLKNVDTGGADAARDLSAQIKSYIVEKKIHDAPSELPVIIYIFAKKKALSKALLDSGTISSSEQLDNFISQLMRSQPFLYFVDCGPDEGVVNSKIQGRCTHKNLPPLIVDRIQSRMNFTSKTTTASTCLSPYVMSRDTSWNSTRTMEIQPHLRERQC